MWRLALVVVVACGTSTSSGIAHTRVLGADKLYIVVEHVVTTTTRRPFDAGATLWDSTSKPIGAVEIDLATGECEWRDEDLTLRAVSAGFVALQSSDTLRVERDALVHASGARVATAASSYAYASGDRIFVRATSGAWLVLDRELGVRDTMELPLGPLAGITRERAVFASPLGTISFEGSRHDGLVAARPPIARETWWNRKRVLEPGDEVVTPRGHRLRRVDGALEVDGVRHEATHVVYFEGTELVSTGATLVDGNHARVISVEVTEVFLYDNQALYLRDGGGRLWYTHQEEDITTALPLAIDLSLIAIRGTRYVFSAGMFVFLFDLRTRQWAWRSWEKCLRE
jgi:hypothetical protein